MIYLDTSIALAHLLHETRVPDARLWESPLASSRLLEYELWNRLHAHGLTVSHGDAARDLLGRVAMLELTPAVLRRALAPFPVPVRTLDGLHLASALYLREQRQSVSLASYDSRMVAAARALDLPVMAV